MPDVNDVKRPRRQTSLNRMELEEEESQVVREEEEPELVGIRAQLTADPQAAFSRLQSLLFQDGTRVEVREKCIDLIGDACVTLGRAEDLRKLMVDIRPFLNTISKPKTAKIVRKLIEQMAKIPNTEHLQLTLCLEGIEWCTREKRTFLKQRIQVRLATVYLALQRYKESLEVIRRAAREVKRFDDKLLLVEIHLLESRVHLSLSNVPKAKGALTSARSAANAIYCPPLLQADIDKQAGTLCAEENDYKTAFSYFYEAFEGYNTVNDPKAASACLKYMLLTKIMLNTPEDVYSIINSKAGIKYAGIEVEAMKAVADAHKKRDIHEFDSVYNKYRQQLGEDALIQSHLAELKNNLLEHNLLRLIEPFSRVQVEHIAKLISLDKVFIEQKLSEMILDKKLSAILDQGSGDLIVFDDTENDRTFAASLDIMKELSKIVDSLYTKAKRVEFQRLAST